MITYNPIDGDPYLKSIDYSPRTCFVMTKLGNPIPDVITEIRIKLTEKLNSLDIKEIDASSKVTGRDLLLKIWKQLLFVPLGIGIVDTSMTPQTMSNIFYEVGVLHSYGKESLIIKTESAKIPSDFVRTEYIVYNDDFESSLDKYFETFFNLEDYFLQMSNQLEKNPLLSIDYLRRAYLISGNEEYRKQVHEISQALNLASRAKNSVENLIMKF